MVRGETKSALLMLTLMPTLVIGAAAGCAGNRAPQVAPRPAAALTARLPGQLPGQLPAALPAAGAVPPSSCGGCSPVPISSDLAAAIEARVADLKTRGGVCEELGIVLESALASGHITLRPYMWRVEGNLASAQGESTGEMTIARDIDSLNVGVRQLDDVLRSAEHEAAHIALHVPNGDPGLEARVDARVNSCRSAPQH